MLNSVTNLAMPPAQPTARECAAQASPAAVTARDPERVEDRLELSAAARARGGHGGAVNARPELVQRIRSEIAGDTYLTDDKLDIAVERMLSDLLGR